MRRRIKMSVVAVLLTVGLTACIHAPRHNDAPPYRNDYYYYPHANVYFQVYSGDYYYRDGPDWRRVRVLPSHIYLDHRVRRTLVIKEPKPYERHKTHRERYKVPGNFSYNRKQDRSERVHNHRRHLEYRQRWERQ